MSAKNKTTIPIEFPKTALRGNLRDDRLFFSISMQTIAVQGYKPQKFETLIGINNVDIAGEFSLRFSAVSLQPLRFKINRKESQSNAKSMFRTLMVTNSPLRLFLVKETLRIA